MSSRHAGLAAVAVAIAVAICAGCSGPAMPRSVSLPAAPGAQQTLPGAADQRPLLYVAGNRLSAYELGRNKPRRSTKPNYSVSLPTLALDSFGNLIEGNGNPSSSQILVYDARTLKLVRTLNGFGWFQSLVVNEAGDIYAGPGGRIAVFSPGAVAFLGFIQRGARSVGPLIFDRSGDLYAGNLEGRSVSVYAPVSGTWRMRFVRSISEGIKGPDALAIGPSGKLFVANWPVHGHGWVSAYSPGGVKLLRKITNGIDAPQALVVDSKEQLYVGNAQLEGQRSKWCGWVSVYRSDGAQLLRKVTDGVCTPQHLALAPQGELYVGNSYAGHRFGHVTVTVYDSGAGRLIRTITKGVDGATLLIGSR